MGHPALIGHRRKLARIPRGLKPFARQVILYGLKPVPFKDFSSPVLGDSPAACLVGGVVVGLADMVIGYIRGDGCARGFCL
jgi:hypothetical protein